MAKSKSWYMHTISGKPAYFAGKQIVYANQRNNVSLLVPDLDTIREQQRLTVAHRTYVGYADTSDDYGYVCFRR